MAKTPLTVEMEKFIYDRQVKDKFGVYGCFEVTIGLGGNEIVDFITYETDGTFRCYEIKTSLADLKSKSKLSFVGHYNYLVMPDDLYHEAKKKHLIHAFNTAVITPLKLYGRSTKKQLSIGKSVVLLESMVRSLSRENMKFINLKVEG